jgi:multiple sugar transport system substrate-binding protein
MKDKRTSRRSFLRKAAGASAGMLLAACQPKTVIVEKEVEKVVTQVVKETVKETVVVEGTPKVVEKEVTKIVEKVVTKEVEKVVAATAEPVDVRVAMYQMGESWMENAEALMAVLSEEQPDVNVVWEWRPGSGFWDKLQTEFAAGVAPDVTVNQMNWVIPGAARGMFLSISPFIDRDGVDMDAYWYPHDLEWEWKDQLYGGLLYAGGEAHYINLDILEASGLDFPDDDWDWNDLLEYATAMTDPDKNQYGLNGANSNVPYWSTSFIHAAGGTVLNDAYDKCTLTSPEARGALQWLLDLTNKHEVMPPPGLFEGQDNPFLTGNIGIAYGGTWFESQVRDAGLNWDFVRQPVHPDTGKRSVQLGSNAWSILANTQHREGAWQVVKHLMGEVGQTYMMKYGLPGLKSVINSEAYLEAHRPQKVERLIADFECCPHDYYPTADTDEWWAALSNELSVVWSGEATVDEATARTCEAADEIFANRPPAYQ